MRFTINLATRTYLDHRLINRVAYCVVALLAVLAVWNISRVASNMGEQSRLNSEIAAIEGKSARRAGDVSEAEYSRQKTRIRFYNGIIDRKSADWLKLLGTFENVLPEGISLSALSQGKKQDEWKVDGRARSFKAVQQYLEKLETSRDFADVLLLSHQSVTGEKGRGVQFSISCRVVN